MLRKASIATSLLFLLVLAVAVVVVHASPATAPSGGEAEAADFPIPIRYTIPQAGNVVIAIDDAQGWRVRNLLTEAPRAAGDNVDLWDGRDDDGKTVKPGVYHFKAAVTPPLDLSYEFTVNNSGDPPWWKQDVWEPRPNPGGWMSDHTPPQGAAAAGDKVFLGSEAAEHGHSLIAVDLNGHKVWGAKWLELAGSRCVCSDGSTIYSAGEGSWVGTHMKLFAIDPNHFAVRRIADIDFGSGLLAGKGNLVGLAARNGQVYASFSPPQKEIGANAFDPAAIDWPNTTTHGLPTTQFAALLRAAESDQPWMNLPLDAARQEPLRISWKSDQNIGTILSPQRLEVWSLRPGAPYPGDLTKDADWIAFNIDEHSRAMKVYTAPPDTRTRALRIRVLGAVPPLRLDKPQKPLEEIPGPASSFVGLRVVGSRLHADGDAGEVAVSSGQVIQGNAWENRQEKDITALNPATYTIQLHEPAEISALVVRDPFFARARVEVQSGNGAGWDPAGELVASFPWRRAYNDITLDFGRSRTASAVRIVVTDPAVDQNSDVKKRTGLTRRVCSLGGVLLLATNPEPGPGQRISVFNSRTGELVRDIPLKSPGALAFDSSERLLAVSNGRIVSVPLTAGPATPVIASGIDLPSGLTCDAKGSIYVADGGENVVKRFDSAGKPAGVIGTPGGINPGPYDPQRMSNPRGICIDANGKLWVAEAEMRPKKVSVWDLQGNKPKLERYFIGGPRYGSGFMYIDPREPSRFFFEGMEFRVDWQTGRSEIKNIVWREGRGGAWEGVTCDRPVYDHNQLYLLGEPFWFYGNRYFAVARYDKDHAVPVAAAGKADQWPPLRDSAILQSLGNPDLAHYSFVWSDLNDNGKVDPGEVKLGPADLQLETPYFGARGGADLTIQFANERFTPVSFTRGGAPVYDFDHMTPMPVLHPGGFGLYGTAETSKGELIEVSDRIAVHDSNGQMRWSYPDRFNGIHGSLKAPPPQPGLLAGTLHVIGCATLQNIGEVFAVSTNKGEVCLFTTDGLWIARLFRDNRYGHGFNLPTAERGMKLNDFSLNTEHFGGSFNQLADGRVFLIAGHNHNSVIRLDGLDRVHRLEGKLLVTEEQARAADKAAKEPAVSGVEPKQLLIARSQGGFKIDGDLADWSKLSPLSLTGTGEHRARVWLAYDPESLLVAFNVQGARGMVNNEKDWKLLFRGGDCVDLQLRTDLKGAKVGGSGVAGDLRIIVTMQAGHPVAVIYRPVVPGTANDKRTTFTSPVGSVTFDVIEQIDLNVAVVERKDGYSLEAAIPWKALGVKPISGLRLLGDIGVLFADKQGLSTVERLYWANRAAGLVADVPGEARLQPEHWHEFELQ